MPAWLTTKCPECDGITGHCLDSTLEKDRTEFDGKRCGKCVWKEKISRRGKPHGLNCGSGNSMFIGRKRMAVQTHQFSGQHY